VDRETARRALESCDEEEQLQTAVSLAEKKIRASRENDRSKLFRQVTGMLQRRGYSWDTAKKAFDQAMETWRE
jgi:SOS response regulatory protein OraA/RecX